MNQSHFAFNEKKKCLPVTKKKLTFQNVDVSIYVFKNNDLSTNANKMN